MERKEQKYREVDVIAAARALWKKKWIVISIGLVAAILSLALTILFVKPLYSSSITLYANNSNSTNVNTSISAQDISASMKLVSTYAAIIMSDPVLDQVVEMNGLNISGQTLQRYIDIASVNNTEVFKITVTYSSPQMAAHIANSIAQIAPEKIAQVVDGCSVKIVSNAKVPTVRSSPNNVNAILTGMGWGMLISSLAILVAFFLDTRIKNREDLARWEYPVLGTIPAFSEAQKMGTYGYGYGRKGGK